LIDLITLILQGRIQDFRAAIPIFNQIVIEETSNDWNFIVEKYEKMRKEVSNSLQAMRTFRDIVGPHDIQRRMFRQLRESESINSTIPWINSSAQLLASTSASSPIHNLTEKLNSCANLHELKIFAHENKLIYLGDTKSSSYIFIRPNVR
jgi:hypothetical protein